MVIAATPRFPPRPPPTEAVELVVERLGAAGDGIAHWRGRDVYLPFTAPGDHVRARIGARRAGGHDGRVVELVAAGAGRASAACRHFGSCGGCALQHLDPPLYRRAKLDGLHAALARRGVEPGSVAPLSIVPPQRRRAKLGLVRPREAGERVRVGFRRRFRHALVDLAECPVLEPALAAAIAGLRQAASGFLRPGDTAEATLTRTDSGVDLLLEATAAPPLRALEALAEYAAADDLARIVWRTGAADLPVVERRPVRVVFSGIAVPFPPGGFLQASAAAERLLVAEIVAGIGPRRPALDLYSGLGAFALALARSGPVHAVDGDPATAAALARATAPQLRVECRDLTRDPLPPAALGDYAAAVLDPPRAGAARQAAALAASTLDTVVVVSCNPKTFARDARLLIGGGFRLERLVPIDQFVWTPHLELVATFYR
jgi:23S rRNA (uracil1939-C5)-methyltransferase